MTTFRKFSYGCVEELVVDAESRGIALPHSDDIDVLFDELYLGERRLKNRFIVQPMEGCDGDRRGAPGGLTLRRYRRYAEGGAALIWFEATAVNEKGRANPSQLMLNAATLDDFKRLVAETRDASTGASIGQDEIMLILQLTHSGRYSSPAQTPAPVFVRHSPALDVLQGYPPDKVLLSDAQLDRLQEEFVAAAKLAAEAGFDGVDIKACHGYLINELLAASSRNGSRYGGSFEGRCRFLVETVRIIHSEQRNMCVASRISAFDAMPYPHGFGASADDGEEMDLLEPKKLVLFAAA